MSLVRWVDVEFLAALPLISLPECEATVPFIEYDQRLFRLKEGANVLGSGDTATIRLPIGAGECRLDINLDEVGAFAWSPNDGEGAILNGRRLESEPVPLFHGDCLLLNGSALVYVDDGGDATVKVGRPAPATVATKVTEGEGKADMVDPERMMRVTPPEPERKPLGVLRRHDNNKSYLIGSSRFRIGREKHCEIILPDPSVSRLHAEIFVGQDEYQLRVMGRTDTLVNGNKVTGPHKLRPGDLIQIGKYEFSFVRRHADGEDLVRPDELTPVRSASRDAATVEFKKKKGGGSHLLTWLIVFVAAALVAAVFFAS